MENSFTGYSLIGGEFSRQDGGRFSAVDPTTGAPIAPVFFSATVEEVGLACDLAAKAFPDYGRRSGQERGALLRAIADAIEALGTRLIDRAMLETALPRPRLEGERARTCGQLRLFAAEAERGSWTDLRKDDADPGRTPVPKPGVISILRPLGPVAVFGASNFPLAFSVAGGDTASALAVGCPVVFKAHPAHPGTSELVGTAISSAVRACHLPAGTFSMVYDGGHDVGLALVRHPAIKAGSFTGSEAGGIALVQAAASRPVPIPFFAEMGSVNPIFIFPGALQAKADILTAGLHKSVTMSGGQLCTKPGVVFLVESPESTAFLAKLAALVQGTAGTTLLTPGILKNCQARVAKASQVAGVRLLAQSMGSESNAGSTLLVTDLPTYDANPQLSHEIFGPACVLVLCPSVAAFQGCAEKLSGQLTATLWAEPEEFRQSGDLLFCLEQKAGRLLANGFPTGVEVNSSMVHGGPFPATSDSRFTSVGTRALLRFVRPVAYQDFSAAFLSETLRTIPA